MASGNSFGDIYRVTTYGESHGGGLGVIIDGCPAGLELSMKKIRHEMNRRKPGQSDVTTQRKEADEALISSGVLHTSRDGIVKTMGHPIHLYVLNKDADPSKYFPIKHNFRPGHADYTYWAKYGTRDWRGGGRSSGRETVGRVLGGAVAKQVLEKYCPDLQILGCTVNVGGVEAVLRDYGYAESNKIRCPDKNVFDAMMEKVDYAKKNHDSVGGAVEVVAKQVPAGLGEPVFDKLNAVLMHALGSIGAVKAVQIGAGINVENALGYGYRDAKEWQDEKMIYHTNNAGGIEGGISTGEDIVIRLSVKPTPTATGVPLLMPTEDGENEEKVIEGRHDPTIMPRMVPVAEAMTAIVLTDFLLKQRAYRE